MTFHVFRSRRLSKAVRRNTNRRPWRGAVEQLEQRCLLDGLAILDVNLAADRVAENAAAAALVGFTANATSSGRLVTYSLLDDADGRFGINRSTGVVTIADAARINFETAQSHTITVEATDGIETRRREFSTAVTNVRPTIPTDAIGAANQVPENAATGVPVGIRANGTDPHGGAVTYSLTNTAGGRFQIDPLSGAVTVANGSLLNYEAVRSHRITVKASDGVLYSTAMFTISVNNVNEPPTIATDADSAPNQIAENVAAGTVVGIMARSSDPERTPVFYALTEDADDRFRINSFTGVVAVADASRINFETGQSHAITVQASDGTTYSTADFVISVTNIAPSTLMDADGAANQVLENSALGALVGLTMSGTDPHGGPLTYSLRDDAGGRFRIDPETGAVSVANGSLLNYEISTTHQVTVQVSDSVVSLANTVTITVLPANDAPVLIPTPLMGNDVDEDAPAPTGVVGQLVSDFVRLVGAPDLRNVSDEDAGAVTGLAVTGSDTTNGTWFFSKDNGATWNPFPALTDENSLLLAADAFTRVYFQPRSNVNGSLTDALTFRAWDQTAGTNGAVGNASVTGGSTAFSSATANMSLVVRPLNDPPTTANVVGNSNEDTHFTGRVTATDVDGDSLTFELATTPSNGSVNVNADSGEFDYSAADNFFGGDEFTIRVRDGRGGTAESVASVTVNPVNDPPIAPTVADMIANQGQSFAASLPYFHDIEDGTLSNLVVTQANGSPLPSWLSYAVETRTLSGTPSHEDVGRLTLAATATDSVGTTGTESFAVTVENRTAMAPASQTVDTLVDTGGVGQAQGKIGNAAHFARAEDQYLDSPDSVDLSMGDIDFSLSAWVNPDSEASEVIIGKGSSKANGTAEYILYLTSSSSGRFFRFVVGNGSAWGGVNSSVTNVSTGHWYFVVAWHDAVNDSLNIQVDGSPVDSAAYSDGSYDSPHPFAIGRHPDVDSGYWHGLIDEVGVFREVLTDQERAQLYNGGYGNRFDPARHAFEVDSGGKLSAQLVTYYTLDERSGYRLDAAHVSKVIAQVEILSDQVSLRRMLDRETLEAIAPALAVLRNGGDFARLASALIAPVESQNALVGGTSIVNGRETSSFASAGIVGTGWSAFKELPSLLSRLDADTAKDVGTAATVLEQLAQKDALAAITTVAAAFDEKAGEIAKTVETLIKTVADGGLLNDMPTLIGAINADAGEDAKIALETLKLLEAGDSVGAWSKAASAFGKRADNIAKAIGTVVEILKEADPKGPLATFVTDIDKLGTHLAEFVDGGFSRLERKLPIKALSNFVNGLNNTGVKVSESVRQVLNADVIRDVIRIGDHGVEIADDIMQAIAAAEQGQPLVLAQEVIDGLKHLEPFLTEFSDVDFSSAFADVADVAGKLVGVAKSALDVVDKLDRPAEAAVSAAKALTELIELIDLIGSPGGLLSQGSTNLGPVLNFAPKELPLSLTATNVIGAINIALTSFQVSHLIGGQLPDTQAGATAAGAASGAAIGAAMGSFLPGIGTSIGALIGFFCGGGGGWVGSRGTSAAEKLSNLKADQDSQAGQARAVADFFLPRIEGLGGDLAPLMDRVANLINQVNDPGDQQGQLAQLLGDELLKVARRHDPNLRSLNDVAGLREAFVQFMVNNAYMAPEDGQRIPLGELETAKLAALAGFDSSMPGIETLNVSQYGDISQVFQNVDRASSSEISELESKIRGTGFAGQIPPWFYVNDAGRPKVQFANRILDGKNRRLTDQQIIAESPDFFAR